MKRRAPTVERAKPAPSTPVISTGSLLLDLAISGGVYDRGGLPGGMLVEIFGPSSTGKTVLLSEIAGRIQKRGGEVRFYDPEGRLNKQFAQLFGLEVDAIHYEQASTVTEVFDPLYKWKPKGEGPHGVFADSLAALSTNLELENDEGDKMGMRRAKEFSEQCRKVARIFPERNILMVCSNQIRQNMDAGPYGQKWTTPGGQAIGFYSSVRLKTALTKKLKKKRTIRGKDYESVNGVLIEVEVAKNSVDKPYRKAPVYIQFDYGIDDVKANLQFVKDATGAKLYAVGDHELNASLDRSAAEVEEQGMVRKLKEEVIGLWNEIEASFKSERKRRRDDDE